jgi:hypothetical protein
MNITTRLHQIESSTLPRANLLFYSRFPNTGDVIWGEDDILPEDMYFGGWVLPAELASAIGYPSFFFDADGVPIARQGLELLAWSGINQYTVIYSNRRGLAVYSDDASYGTVRNAFRYFKQAVPTEIDLTGYDIYYSSDDGEVARKGTITWTDRPKIDADGVTPGDGPAFTDSIDWSNGKRLVIPFFMPVGSAELVGDVPLITGLLYANSSGLKVSDGTNNATYATSWASGDVVTVVIETETDGVRQFMRCGRV